MLTARRRRTRWALAASTLAHLAVGFVLVLQRPTLLIPDLERGPPEPVIPILIMPRTPPPAAGARLTQLTPIRLHRRPQPNLPPDVPPAPVAAPIRPAAAAQAPVQGPVALHPAPMPEGPKGDVRTALRQSFVGCANAQAVGLNKAERDLCDERFGKGAKDAPFAGLGLAAAKQRLLEAAGARKEADYRYKYANLPNAGPTGAVDVTDSISGVAGIGVGAHGMGQALGNDRPEAKAPF
jgi:hypothetical protein